MNDLFKLTTITPEFDFNQLEDEMEYDCKIKHQYDGITSFSTRLLIYRKNYKTFWTLNKYESVTGIYLPHTEEKKVSKEEESRLNIHERRVLEQNKTHVCNFCLAKIYGYISDDIPNTTITCFCNKCQKFCKYKYWGTMVSPSVEVSKESLSNWNEVFESYKLETAASAFATHNFAKWLNKNYPVTLQEVTDEEIRDSNKINFDLMKYNNDNNKDVFSDGFWCGILWMRDKLKGGNTK